MVHRRHVGLVLIFILLLFIVPSAVFSQPIHVQIETPEQDKAFSEFNHHVAGVFLIAIGVLAVLSRSSAKLLFLGKVWPFLFILPGLYLALMSDPDVWPMGFQDLIQAFQTNPEARQHKIFSLLLLTMGILEFQRARGKLGRFMAVWSFPALAIFGAILLFFHQHMGGSIHGEIAHNMPGMSLRPETGMHSMEGHESAMTANMLKIKRQHFWFSIVGFCVAFFKFLGDGRFWKKSFVPILWPVFILILGVLLVLYAE